TLIVVTAASNPLDPRSSSQNNRASPVGPGTHEVEEDNDDDDDNDDNDDSDSDNDDEKINSKSDDNK
ncbi:hypothetical protein LTR28_013907, partial [Elasticomyces elasticus]